jgi:hypothetical protein
MRPGRKKSIMILRRRIDMPNRLPPHRRATRLVDRPPQHLSLAPRLGGRHDWTDRCSESYGFVLYDAHIAPAFSPFRRRSGGEGSEGTAGNGIVLRAAMSELGGQHDRCSNQRETRDQGV